jgi:UDP-N-acetylmuramoyl-tripeptide--D-alanyl-D-alanine ligase
MLELGDAAPGYHAGLAPECTGLDGVVCVGPLMKNLYDVLPANLRLFYQPDPSALQPQDVTALLHTGDTVVVKGSKKIFFVRQFVPKLIEALKA